MAFFHMSLRLSIALLICTSMANSQIDTALSFYPLDTGNSWQYKSTHTERLMGGVIGSSTHYYTVKINGDTTITNGKRYFVILTSDGSRAHPRYQRIDSLTSQVFAFDTSNGGKEYQIDSLRAPARSSFAGCRWSVLKGTFMWNVDSQNYFGIRSISRHYLTPSGVGEGSPYILYTLAQNFGLTTVRLGSTGFDQYEGSSTDDTLVYAKINGKVYGTLVSVRQNRKEVDANFTLEQNYSNPFNPTTIIRYALPEGDHVSMKVYDVLGKQVTTLTDEWQPAGLHTAIFSANSLSSGAYFLNFRAGRFNTTKKILFLK